MKLRLLSFLSLATITLTSCNSKAKEDLDGSFIDEFGIELLSLKKQSDSVYILSNHNSSLEMQRFDNTLKGLVKATGNKDTIYFRFISADTVIHELWKNQTIYTRADSARIEEFNKIRLEYLNPKTKPKAITPNQNIDSTNKESVSK